MRVGADDEKIGIGAQPQCLERPSVATCVSARGVRSVRRTLAGRGSASNASVAQVGGRCGQAETQRLTRDGSRLTQPNDLVEIAGPWRASWRRPRPSKVRSGQRTSGTSKERAADWRPASSPTTQSCFRVRALTPQFSCKRVNKSAGRSPAQSEDRLSAATHVRKPVELRPA